MTKLERRIRKMNKQLEIFYNDIVKPLIDALIPLYKVFVDAFRPIIEDLKEDLGLELEKKGLYIREINEPTDLGWFLINIDTICMKLRELFMDGN